MHSADPEHGGDELASLVARLGLPAEQRPAVAALSALGISEAAMRRAVERGRLEDAVFDAVLDPERAGRHVSPREIEAAGGLSVTAQQEFMLGFGLRPPEPDEPYFTDTEREALIELAEVEVIWPARARMQAARVYGLALARIVRAELALFRMQFAHDSDGASEAASLEATRSAFERLLPLADSLLVTVHRRWAEQELAAAAAFEATARVGAEAVPGSVRVTVVFCDLKSFTAYADTHGDAAAVRAVEGFADIVYQERGEGEIVKALGDGYMLAYASAGDAVAALRRIAAEARQRRLPDVHASAHTGLAIQREGDYLGGAVNIAARLLARSGGGELLATAAMADAADADLGWERRGEMSIRGLRNPVEVVTLKL